eukprot:4718981-Amphidinium_carterae.1
MSSPQQLHSDARALQSPLASISSEHFPRVCVRVVAKQTKLRNRQWLDKLFFKSQILETEDLHPPLPNLKNMSKNIA